MGIMPGIMLVMVVMMIIIMPVMMMLFFLFQLPSLLSSSSSPSSPLRPAAVAAVMAMAAAAGGEQETATEDYLYSADRFVEIELPSAVCRDRSFWSTGKCRCVSVTQARTARREPRLNLVARTLGQLHGILRIALCGAIFHMTPPTLRHLKRLSRVAWPALLTSAWAIRPDADTSGRGLLP